MEPIKPEKFFTKQDREWEDLRIRKLFDAQERAKFKFADAYTLMKDFVKPPPKLFTPSRAAKIQNSYTVDKDSKQFLRTIKRQAVYFTKQFIERGYKTGGFSNDWAAKQRFMFGEVGEILFSETENSTNPKEKRVFEKTFTRKPFAQEGQIGLKRPSLDHASRPMVRQIKKRASLSKRHPETIFDNNSFKQDDFVMSPKSDDIKVTGSKERSVDSVSSPGGSICRSTERRRLQFNAPLCEEVISRAVLSSRQQREDSIMTPPSRLSDFRKEINFADDKKLA